MFVRRTLPLENTKKDSTVWVRAVTMSAKKCQLSTAYSSGVKQSYVRPLTTAYDTAKYKPNGYSGNILMSAIIKKLSIAPKYAIECAIKNMTKAVLFLILSRFFMKSKRRSDPI